MQIVPGTVVEGKIVLEGASFPEGTTVVVIAKDAEPAVRLSPDLLAELDQALAEADSEDGIPGDTFLESLKKYG
ncbi:MAG: hypothetical protein WBP72_17845 [Rhodocyclaceae bacterium]